MHAAHWCFSLPWGQGVHSAQLLFNLPWGHGLHCTQSFLCFPCKHLFRMGGAHPSSVSCSPRAPCAARSAREARRFVAFSKQGATFYTSDPKSSIPFFERVADSFCLVTFCQSPPCCTSLARCSPLPFAEALPRSAAPRASRARATSRCVSRFPRSDERTTRNTRAPFKRYLCDCAVRADIQL